MDRRLDWPKAPEFWVSALAELTNRGVTDVLIVVCDGLKGLPDAVEATWPQATIQTCVLHLLHAPSRYVLWQDKTRVLTELKNIYNAPASTQPNQRSPIPKPV
ncbi:MAG: transposase [Acidimicrobiia bacterium]|nr:transposase [Acidimicrobiia bacterium]